MGSEWSKRVAPALAGLAGRAILGLIPLAGLLWLATPASAIVVAGGDPNDVLVSGSDPVVNGINLSGVVKLVTSGGFGCTGSLLSDGYSVLTAGHCVADSFSSMLPDSATAYFLSPGGPVGVSIAAFYVDPGWTGDLTQGGDLAVLRLSEAAPLFATRYSLFSELPTIDLTVVDPILIAGYGYGGTGATGANSADYGFGKLRWGTNQYVGTGSVLGWSSTLLVGQFYDPANPGTNALGVPNPYAAENAADIAHGDSGGPSFYNGRIVGVHDAIVCYSGPGGCAVPPSVSTSNNSYFGQIFSDTGVYSSMSWIEAQMVPEPGGLGWAGLGLAIAGYVRSRRLKRGPLPRP